jgi:hypothetical protein
LVGIVYCVVDVIDVVGVGGQRVPNKVLGRDDGGSQERESKRAREGGIMRRDDVVYDSASMSGRRWVLSPVNGAEEVEEGKREGESRNGERGVVS